MKFYKIIFFATILFFFSLQPSLACICEMNPPPCYAYWESQAVFVGTIKNIFQDSETSLDKVEIEVEQNYRGITKKTVFTHNHAHSCAHTVKGKKYLFYGDINEKDKSYFGTSLCSRTKLFDEKLIDFDFLNSLNNSAPNYWIWGTITKIPNESYFGHQPLQEIQAQVFDNKKKLIGVSDENGNLKISVSKEGIYKVRVFPPKGTMLDHFEIANSPFMEKLKTLKGKRFKKNRPFFEYEVEVKANKCGWFYLPLEKYKKE